MKIKYFEDEKILLVELKEDIDHHRTQEIRNKLDGEIRRRMPYKLVFDFSDIGFMDSAGIGMILGRYNLMRMIGGKVEVGNMKSQVKRILEMSGVMKVVSIVDLEQYYTKREE